MGIRKAMFAGSWYPATAAACEAEIKDFLEAPGIDQNAREPVRGGIFPMPAGISRVPLRAM